MNLLTVAPKIFKDKKKKECSSCNEPMGLSVYILESTNDDIDCIIKTTYSCPKCGLKIHETITPKK